MIRLYNEIAKMFTGSQIEYISWQAFTSWQIDGVLAVHEFHVWQLAGNRIIATAHIRCRNLTDYNILAEKVKSFFHNEGIHSTTIQPEFTQVHNYNKLLHARKVESPANPHYLQPATVTDWEILVSAQFLPGILNMAAKFHSQSG